MTTTETLRAMLDERGVKWKRKRGRKHDGTEWYDQFGVYAEAVQEYSWDGFEHPEGKLLVRRGMGYLTPEQAIAATLGAGTCHNVCNSVSEFTCSACGFNCDITSWISLFDGDDGRHRHHHHGTPNFCPNCGRKVVAE